MKPIFCFDHKDEHDVDIPKKHILFTDSLYSHIDRECVKPYRA